ncbi:MAG TPA: Imm51 family immunity protein [Mucilaginibacter sp.]|jgi:hypothetical protein
MEDFVAKIKHGEFGSFSVCFYIEQDRIMEIGKKMNEINEMAYMNGYNWEAFLKRYLQINHPDILGNMESDHEAGMYAAYFESNPENEKRADKLVEIIKRLVENENEIYKFVTIEGGAIEWD